MGTSAKSHGVFDLDPDHAPTTAAGEDFRFSAAILDDGTVPEWIELLPAGSFSRRDNGRMFRLESPEAVIEATLSLRMEAGLPIDYDHSTDLAAPEGRPAPAAGWIVGLERRAGAIWGRVQWTRRGAQAIRSRQYRYISPVFQHSSSGEVIRILRAALTNNPALHLTAIAAGGNMSEENNQQGADEMSAAEFQHRIAEILGLDADAPRPALLEATRRSRGAHRAHHRSADEADAHERADGYSDPLAGEDLVAAASGSLGAAPWDPVRYVPIAEFEALQTSFNALKNERAREHAERAVDEAIRSGRLIPAQREWATAYCMADAKSFVAFAARQPAILGGGTAEVSLVGAPPNRSRTQVLSEAECLVCARLGISREDFLKRRSQTPQSA